MNYDEQIVLIRKQNHQKYLKHIDDKKIEENELIKKKYDADLRQKKINIMTKINQRYHRSYPLSKSEATKIIQKFIKKNYFEPQCINEDEIKSILPLYRIRILITNTHINEYSEEGIPQNEIAMHRLQHLSNKNNDKYIFFRYCFDIRKLYSQRNQLIEIYDNFYFMQPNDHIKIDRLWRKINGITNASIIYMSQFEYWKLLSIEKYKNQNDNNSNINQNDIVKINTIKNNMEKILDEEVAINVDMDYLDKLNKQYISQLLNDTMII